MTDLEIVRLIVTRFEGGFVDDPADRGGATKYGVTRETLAAVRGSATVADVQALTKDEALDILLERYVMRPGFFQIADWRLRLAVIDYGIHSGPRTAAKALQTAIGVDADGSVGRETLERLARADSERVREKVIAARLRHLGKLVTDRPSQAKYAAGWLSRVGAILEAA